MKRLLALALGLAGVCGMTAFAQTTTPAGAPTPQPGVEATAKEGPEESIARAERTAAAIVDRAIRRAEKDPALCTLVSQALTDRTVMLQAQLKRVAALQALVTAIQAGDQPGTETARQNLKTAAETVATDAKTVLQDVEAIRTHLKADRGAKRGARGAAGVTAAPVTPE